MTCPRGCLPPEEGGSYQDWIYHQRAGEPRCDNSKASWRLYIKGYRKRRKALQGPTARDRQRERAEAARERLRAAREQAAQLRRNEERLKKNG